MFRPARTALWTVHEVYECHFNVSNLKTYTWQCDGESAKTSFPFFLSNKFY